MSAVLPCTMWNLSKYRVFSGPYFPAFGLDTKRYFQIRSFFWSVSSRIRTEYGEIRSISPYSVRIRKIRTRKTPYLDTFHAGMWVHFFFTLCNISKYVMNTSHFYTPKTSENQSLNLKSYGHSSHSIWSIEQRRKKLSNIFLRYFFMTAKELMN